MIRWLKYGQGDSTNSQSSSIPITNFWSREPAESNEQPGSRKVYQLILDDYPNRKKQGTISELQAGLRRLKIPTEASSPAVTVSDESSGPEQRGERVTLESEPGIEISGKLYILQASGQKPAVLLNGG
jgi:hypothetical protein